MDQRRQNCGHKTLCQAAFRLKMVKSLTLPRQNIMFAVMNEEKMNAMKVVSLRTGLSPHVIRAWEKRYGAIAPLRTDSNHRLYSNDDIERLILLHKVTTAGHAIGRVARLPMAELAQLVSDAAPRQQLAGSAASLTRSDVTPAQRVQLCLDAIAQLDGQKLESEILRASVSLSQPMLIDDVIVPLIHKIGDLWREGDLRIVHEHVASQTLAALLTSMRSSYQTSALAPRLAITTPAQHVHELGALLVATTAAALGWHTTYLGPNLPAEEIASAVVENQAALLCLSIVHPSDDHHTVGQLIALRRLIPQSVAIFVGGRAAGSYRETLTRIDATLISDIKHLRRSLEAFPAGEPGAKTT
jgi:DNA-binding transcriptional MerR regulator/methylmalonyl-CoA mutase cobalamin-binding subunit